MSTSPLYYPRKILDEVIKKRPRSDQGTLRKLVDTVFFASSMPEEGAPVRMAVVHNEGGASALAKVVDSRPEAWGEDGPPPAWNVTAICPGDPARHLPFEPRTLAKLSRGLQYGTHLVVVGGRPPKLRIDGIARRAPLTDGGRVIRIAAPRPGVIVLEGLDGKLLRYDAGRRVETFDVLGSEGPVHAAIATIMRQAKPGLGSGRHEWAIMQLLRQMRATGAGAILAMLPEVPAENVLKEVRYRRVDAKILSHSIKAELEKWTAWIGARIGASKKERSADNVERIVAKRKEHDIAREALDAAIDDVAQLSAIDGAVLAGPKLEIYGAGYIIPVPKGAEPKLVKALDAGIMKKPKRWSQPYGARHKAAFSFAHDNSGGVAFVVSEDGPVHCAFKVGNEVVVWPVYVSET